MSCDLCHAMNNASHLDCGTQKTPSGVSPITVVLYQRIVNPRIRREAEATYQKDSHNHDTLQMLKRMDRHEVAHPETLESQDELESGADYGRKLTPLAAVSLSTLDNQRKRCRRKLATLTRFQGDFRIHPE